MTAWLREDRAWKSLAVLIPLILLWASFGPPEKTLGPSARWAYLHGAAVWVGLLGYSTAGIAALVGFLLRRDGALAWAQALGRSAWFFWVAYVLTSFVASALLWGGIFWGEPRYRIAFQVLGIGFLFLLAGVIAHHRSLEAGTYLFTALFIWIVLPRTGRILHPRYPILNSPSWLLKAHFAVQVGLNLLAFLQLARGWRCWEALRVEGEIRPDPAPSGGVGVGSPKE